MGRREFITLADGAAVALALPARAQRAKVPVVGMLGAGMPASRGKWIDALVGRLLERGWTNGDTLKIEYRWAEGRDERVANRAA